jgi:hypothetical protein
MTAKNRNQPSKLFDAYHTPTQLVRAGFDMLCGLHGEWLETVESFVEPGCGPGSFCWGANLYCRNLKSKPVGVDIFPVKERRTDFKLVEKNFKSWQPKERFDLAITNPPFSWATEFIRHTAELLSPRGKALFLMPLSVATTRKRYEMWNNEVNLCEVWACVSRPGFTSDGGTDAAEYAFFLFDAKGPPYSQNVKMRWIDWTSL